MRKKTRMILLGSMFAFSFLFMTPGSGLIGTAKAVPPIKIGMVQSISGPVSEHGMDLVEGAQVRVDEANEKGGIATREGKRSVELLVRDNKLKPDIAVKNAKELVFQEKCDVLSGCISSSCMLAVSEWCRENKVILWGWGRTAPATASKGHRYFFRSTGNTWMKGQAAALYWKDKPYTRWGLIHPDYTYGRSVAAAFINGMEKWKPGFEVVSEQWPKLGTADFSAYITALMAAKPEGIFTSIWGTDAMTFIKQAKGYGLFNQIKVCGLSWGMPLLRPMGQEMVEGIYVMTIAPFEYPGSPQNKAFYDTYKQRRGNMPSSYSFHGYHNASFIIAGIEKAETTETEALVDAYETICIDTITPFGKICLRECDHQVDLGDCMGITVRDPKWPWFVVKEVTVLPGAPTMRSCAQIMAGRAKGQ